jgi:hypothetical protein
LALGVLVHVAGAAVFSRIPKTPVPALEQLGGRTLQTGDVRVNGTPGTLTVLGFDMSAAGVCNALAAALERPDVAQAGSSGALLFAWPTDKGTPPHVLVQTAGAADHALAIVIDLPPDAPDASPTWPWQDIAAPPSFLPGFSAEDADGRTSLVTGSSSLAPEQARSELAERLASAGWVAATPAAEVVSTALFARGTETLVATVLPPSGTDQPGSRLLILRRRPR